MERVSLSEAAGRRWDCIIVGSSFAAMFFARGLNAAGRRPSILVVERGEFASHADQVRDQSLRPFEDFSQANHAGDDKAWVASKIFGGNSNCWSACIPRFHPNDFRTASLYGVGVDWPIGYDDLEEEYCEVEELMDAAGGGSDHILPRSRPFPMPPHMPSGADIVLRERDPGAWFAQPAARSNGGRRPRCCANAICRLCPIDAKFSILNTIDLFDTEETRFLLGHEARSVVTAGGRADGVMVRDASGAQTEIKADLVALGANAISNAAILLRTGLQNPHLGRGINEQPARIVTYDIPFPNYFGGTHITGHGYGLYDGDFRRERAGMLIEVRNDLAVARLEPGKWLNNLRLKFIAGAEVNPQNRLTLVDDEPHIEWHGYGRYALDALDGVVETASALLPSDFEVVDATGVTTTESHIQGMTPMAASEADGVVDAGCQTFEVGGLYAVGAGVFPTCSPANPTLTLAAVALRAGRAA